MTSNKLLVQKHRAKNAAEGLGRMEVTLGRGLITQARDLAQQRRCPLWQVVQDALLAYIPTGNAAETGNGK
jgi:hypothetical protein